MIDSFRCIKDNDIEYFLKNKAIAFDIERSAKTFIIFDEDRYINRDYFIEGYFSLAVKALSCSDMSKTLKKKLGRGIPAEAQPFILVAQLGKYISESSFSEICIDDILEHVDIIVGNYTEMIPIKLLLVECNKDVFDKRIYQDAGFSFLQTETRINRDTGLPVTFYQLYKHI